MKTLTISLLVIGVILVAGGLIGEHRSLNRGHAADTRVIYAYPTLLGVAFVVLDAVVLVGWGVWHLFTV